MYLTKMKQWSRTQDDRGINDRETDPGTEHRPTKYGQWFNICKIAQSNLRHKTNPASLPLMN